MKIIQISDSHFSKNNDLLFNQINAEQGFDLIIPEIISHNPDYIFFTGDISQDGSLESYLKIKHRLSNFKCPKFIIPGNHDKVDNFKYLLDSDNIFYTEHLGITNYRFIFIDTQMPNSDSGIIKQAEILKIKRLIDPNKLNILILHHHFLPTNAIIDDYIIENNEVFIKFLQENQHSIHAIFHGHVHNGYQTFVPKTNINVYACPATCVQFNLSRTLNLGHSVGFRVITLDNGLKTFPVLI